jgi:hypothetical protein
VREDKSPDPEDAAASTIVNPASIASAVDVGALMDGTSTPVTSLANADEDPRVAPNDTSDGLAPSLKMGKDSGSRDEADTS